MSLTVVSVAYPLAPVGADAVGGAEQVLSALDAALVRAGHRSIVIACEGSSVSGELVTLALPAGDLTEEVKSAARAACKAKLEEVLGAEHADLVHFHGLDFYAYQPALGPTALCTLHLPPQFYPPEVFAFRPGVYVHCVSASQRALCPPGAALLEDIPNGVDLARFAPAQHKAGYALVLSRICPEKGIHLALDAARAAGVPLILAGRVFPYPDHVRYFEREVAPRLDGERRFIGPVGGHAKAVLLAEARCLVVASLVAETSSLIAMEALASGTPVVALRAGALPEIVEHGKTGFLASSFEELTEGVRRAAELRPADCRARAEQNFSVERMCERYLSLYSSLAPRIAPPSSGSRVARGHLQVDELRTRADIEKLREDWAALWARCPSATGFQSPEWLLCWCDHLLRGEIRALAMRSAGRLVGIVPAFSWMEGTTRVISLMGAGVSDYQDVLFEPAWQEECIAALEGWLRDCGTELERAEWSELPAYSALLRVRVHDSPRIAAQQDVCPGVMLQGAGERGRGVPAARWKQVEYARRRVQRECGLAYEEVNAENFDTLFADLESLHGRRWALRHVPGVLADDRVRAFHRAAAQRLLSAGRIMLHAVRLGGERAAVLYGFHDRGCTRYYLSGFEPRFSKYSPGLLAVARGIEIAAARGMQVFDFLRGAEPYKYAWGARDLCRLYRRVITLAPSGALARPLRTDALSAAAGERASRRSGSG